MKHLARREILDTLVAQSLNAKVGIVERAVRVEGFEPIAVYGQHVIMSKEAMIFRAGFTEESGTVRVDFDGKTVLNDAMIAEDEVAQEQRAVFEAFVEDVLGGKSSEAREKLRTALRVDQRYTEV